MITLKLLALAIIVLPERERVIITVAIATLLFHSADYNKFLQFYSIIDMILQFIKLKSVIVFMYIDFRTIIAIIRQQLIINNESDFVFIKLSHD